MPKTKERGMAIPSRTAQTLILPVLIILVCAMMAAFSAGNSFFVTLEHKTVDWRIHFRTPDPAFGRDVVVVLLDEAVMEKLPFRSPVPRAMLSRLIDIIHRSGARLIALDVFLKNLTVEKDDLKLAAVLKKSDNVLIAAALREAEGHPVVDLPHKLFLDRAIAVGLADLPIDPVDQRIREFQSFFTVNGDRVPTLATALFLLAHDHSRPADRLKPWPNPDSGDIPVTLDSRNRAFINYQAPPFGAGEKHAVATYPASAVLTGFLPGAWFDEKIVLIGAGYADNTDAYRTPYYAGRYRYALTPGVEIHANALATLFGGETIHFLGTVRTFFLTLVFSLVLFVIERRFNMLVSGAVLVLLVIGYATASFVVFERTRLALPIVPFCLTVLAVYLIMAIYRSLTEGRQKRWIKNAFKMYLSPDFVNVLLKKPDLLYLGGVEREMTILFSDLQGFTSLSEGMSPTDLVDLLNEYLDGMTRILLDHGGTLDKYEGDAIMAFWGAPMDQPDHAVLAVRAALKMSRFSDRLSESFQAQGRPPIKTRIGLNTGMAVVGNIGSKRRFNYTIIGDEVNLASRLEGANKQYGTFLMISENTYHRVKGQFQCRKLDLIRVKGKAKPVGVHEVLGLADESCEDTFLTMLDHYHSGLEAYKKSDWKSALDLFDRALACVPEDGPSLTYRDRCLHFMASPPPPDWGGVFTMTTK